MTDFETITLNTDSRGIATITLNRPNKHNAMDGAMIRELSAAADRCSQNDDVRAVILAAKGKSFCAGGDLGWMREQADKDRAGKIAEARILADMLARLNNLPKPVVARVHGNAFGGGVGLMAICDVVVASPDIRFGLTETKLGLIPATIGPFVVRRMGEGFARQVFFTAKGFGVDLALRSGLVSSISDDLDEAVEAEISAVLKTAPDAVADAKRLCLKLGGGVSKDEIDITIEALADRWESDEAQAGIAAFFASEPAPWMK